MIKLNEYERLDDLSYKGRRLIQNTKEFCFGMDAVLLAHFPLWKKCDRVLELGTGVGVIPLLIADEVDKISAIELNATLFDLAKRNTVLNGLNDKIELTHGDLRQISRYWPPKSFDVVITNPPYRLPKRGKISPTPSIAAARHEITATLKDVVTAARYALRCGGKLTMINLAERLPEITVVLSDYRFAVKRLRFVHPRSGKEAKLVLIEATLGGNSGTKILPPLIIRTNDGVYTDEISRIYGL